MNDICLRIYLKIIIELLIDRYKECKEKNELVNEKLSKTVTIGDFCYFIAIRKEKIYIQKLLCLKQSKTQ